MPPTPSKPNQTNLFCNIYVTNYLVALSATSCFLCPLILSYHQLLLLVLALRGHGSTVHAKSCVSCEVLHTIQCRLVMLQCELVLTFVYALGRQLCLPGLFVLHVHLLHSTFLQVPLNSSLNRLGSRLLHLFQASHSFAFLKLVLEGRFDRFFEHVSRRAKVQAVCLHLEQLKIIVS